MIKLAPSILSADFARLGEAVRAATAAGADYIHVDVMDGNFVPEITFGAAMVRAIKRGGYTHLPLDVHLMVAYPERQVPLFADAGADIITVHAEASPHLHGLVRQIKAKGKRAGVSLNPGTPLSAVEEVLPILDLVLVMTVDPGYGGQPFIAEMLPKIRRLRRMLDEGHSRAELEVDGGINEETAPNAVRAGARVLVAGSAIFNDRETVAEAVARLRNSVAGLDDEK